VLVIGRQILCNTEPDRNKVSNEDLVRHWFLTFVHGTVFKYAYIHEIIHQNNNRIL